MTARRYTMIKDIEPRLPVLGRIKIGEKGEERKKGRGKEGTYQLPRKLDHFRITTTERGEDNNFLIDRQIHEMLGGDKPTEIPVRLMFDDMTLNFQSRYVCYDGKKVFCTGDGETAIRGGKERKCPCERREGTYAGANKCKPNGVLLVVIDGAQRVGGVWKYTTTSWNIVSGLMASLSMLQAATNGVLAGIPLVMKLAPQTVTDPIQNRSQTMYMVSLDFRGSIEDLQDAGYRIALHREKHNVRIKEIESMARKALEYDPGIMELDDDAPDEFYPEDVIDTEGHTVIEDDEDEPLKLEALYDELCKILTTHDPKFDDHDLGSYMAYCLTAINDTSRPDDQITLEYIYDRALNSVRGDQEGVEKFLKGYTKYVDGRENEPTMQEEKDKFLNSEPGEEDEPGNLLDGQPDEDWEPSEHLIELMRATGMSIERGTASIIQKAGTNAGAEGAAEIEAWLNKEMPNGTGEEWDAFKEKHIIG